MVLQRQLHRTFEHRNQDLLPLLKEMVCRIIATPSCEDHDIELNFSSSNAGGLLLCMRAKLRIALKYIDQRVFLIE